MSDAVSSQTSCRRTCANRAGFGVLIFAILVCWGLFNIGFRPPPSALLSPDYATLSAAQGINIDSWIHEGGTRQISSFQTTHPGIPFQLLSYATYRLAYANMKDFDTRLAAYAADPERYAWAMQFSSLLLFLFGIWLLRQWIDDALLVSATVAFFLLYGASWDSTFQLLTIESPVLAIAALATLVVISALKHRKSNFVPVILGAVFALIFLNKLNYIVWAAAAGLMLLVVDIGDRRPIREIALRALLFSATFVGTVLALMYLLTGAAGLSQMLSLHMSVFTHTGMYGGGASGLVDLEMVQNAFKALGGSYYALGFATLMIVLLVAPIRLKMIGRHQPLPQYLPPLTLFLWSAAVLGFLVTIRHFSVHYLVPPIALASVLLILWLRYEHALVGKVVAVGLIGLSIWNFAERAPRSLHWQGVMARGFDAEAAAVMRLPLEPGEVRLWGYQTRHPAWRQHFIGVMAGYPDTARKLDAFTADDEQIEIWSEKCPEQVCAETPKWRYAVFNPRFPIPVQISEKGSLVTKGEYLVVYKRSAQ